MVTEMHKNDDKRYIDIKINEMDIKSLCCNCT